ncbi:hypothetical protein QL285_036924 [Trifolium repens]|nr:hypothetical protein QL285_036924 [Trifolium repens]
MKQKLPEDKTADADAKEVNPDTQIPANLNRFGNLQRLKKSPANLNRFEKWSENPISKKTNHAASTAISTPPTTTTTTSPQQQQSSPKLDPGATPNPNSSPPLAPQLLTTTKSKQPTRFH